MSRSPVKSVFISYRRTDSWQMARWLAETISHNFGESSVFIDTGIPIGGVWPKRIQSELRKASALIVVIGRNWLTELDKDENRRIDNVHDWVRREIDYGIRNKLKIFPVRVSGASLPSKKGLPPLLTPLLGHRDVPLRDEQRETDVELLLNRLEELGFVRKAARIKYPAPGSKAPSLTDKELRGALKRLPEWELDNSRVSPERKKKLELMRTYEFSSFEDAIHFMSTSSRFISDLDHHPDWENIWKTISVWLTTWDIGHRPSHFDVKLAIYLDELYQQYEADDKPGAKVRSTRRKHLS